MSEEKKNLIEYINLDDKDLIIGVLGILGVTISFVTLDPASSDIVKMIVSGLLGMAIGRKKK